MKDLSDSRVLIVDDVKANLDPIPADADDSEGEYNEAAAKPE